MLGLHSPLGIVLGFSFYRMFHKSSLLTLGGFEICHYGLVKNFYVGLSTFNCIVGLYSHLQRKVIGCSSTCSKSESY